MTQLVFGYDYMTQSYSSFFPPIKINPPVLFLFFYVFEKHIYVIYILAQI
jgi:hypothetical protein